jgi:N-glycosylase/DNA lyase
VELRAETDGIVARTIVPPGDWMWLKHFLQVEISLGEILKTFPADDECLRQAVSKCCGLRLLRQDPWECLASFILSSTKQIVQIRQIVRELRQRFGDRVATPTGTPAAFAFPQPEQLAVLSEAELRQCKMGFRAPYLRAAAQRVAAGEIDLTAIERMELPAAREELLRFAGVGEKIADCVLLFAYGFPTAFPVDVWVHRVLMKYYFRSRKVSAERLRKFVCQHFGPHAGYAQQYLFHYERTLN